MSKSPKPGWYGFNPFERDVKDDPHAMLRELREQSPVNLTPDGRWRLSRYVDLQKLLKNSSVGMRDLDGCIPDHTREESDASKFMLRMDPPDHDRLRGLVSKAFTPRALAAIEPQVRQMVDTELDKVVPSGEMDFASDLALLVPAASMAAMLGIPLEDRDRPGAIVAAKLPPQSFMMGESEGPLLRKRTFIALRILLKDGLQCARIRPKVGWGERQKYSESRHSGSAMLKGSERL